MTEQPMPTENELAQASSLLWEESRRQVTIQEADLGTLRNRALALLSVSSLVAGLFGGRLIAHHHATYVTVFIAFALVFFALGVLSIVVVLAPRVEGFEFTQNLVSYFTDLKEGKLAPIDVTANLAEHFELSRIKNKAVIECLYKWLLVACIFTGLQVVAWGISVM